MRILKFWWNMLTKQEQCMAKTQMAGGGVSDKSAVYCQLPKHHAGFHIDYSGRRKWK